MADHPPTSSVGLPSRRSITVAPLNQIELGDVALTISAFDHWLSQISDGTVGLNSLRAVAGHLPAVRNILNLADLLGDVVTLTTHEDRSVSDWAIASINLIGMMPGPATAAARMLLRPTLFLARQELLNNGNALVGEALLNTLTLNLNSSIRGELENFVQQTQQRLPSLLDEAATFGESLILDIAGGLDVLAKTTVPGVIAPGQSGAGDTAWRDPSELFSSLYDAAVQFRRHVRTEPQNPPPHIHTHESRAKLTENAQVLRQFGALLASQVRAQANPSMEGSVGWITAGLLRSIEAPGLFRSLATNIKPDTTNVGGNIRSGEALEARVEERPAKQDPNACKSGAPTGTGGSISFATGSEALSQTDFVLSGPFPISWTRTYRSSLSSCDDGELGARWITPYTTRFDIVGTGLRYHGADGRSLSYPLPKVGMSHADHIEDLTLVRSSDEGLQLHRGVERIETYQRHGNQFLLVQIELRGGAGLLLGYDHRVGQRAVLSDLVTYQDDASQLHLHLRTDVDEHGRIIGLWLMGEHERRLCLYHYDDASDLTLAQDENTAVWTYQYQHHLITRYTDRTGRGMNLEWQGDAPNARAVREWADDGSFDTQLRWDANLRLVYVTDAHGQETRHYYDSLGYTYRIIHPDKRSEWFFRDAAKNVVHHIHPDGSKDRYAYDESGNLLEHIRADDTTVHYAWDTRNQLIKISDAESGLWLRDYDTRGRLTEAIDPLGNKTEYTYNLMGMPVTITDASGKQKQLAYNTGGQLIRYTDCSGKSSEWEYDERGRLTLTRNATGQVLRYRHEAGNLVTVTYSDGSEEKFERDAEGRLLGHVDALGRVTTWDYSIAGLLAKRVDAAGQSLRYQWDKLGQLTALRNENGLEAEFVYDPVGRLLSETGFDGATTRYQYEEETGRLARAVDGQRITAFTFDPMGRLSERRAALQTGDSPPNERDWQVETFAYDGNGNLALAMNADSCLQWFHDPAGNLVREHQHYTRLGRPLVAVWQHEYDALNQRIATVRPDGHRVSWLTYGSGHLLALQLDDRELIGYERDDLHREVARLQGNRLLQTQKWDALGRLSEQVLAHEAKGRPGQTAGGDRLLVRSYRYDASGQLTDINDTRRGQLAYRYDPVGRLLEAQSRLGLETFAFDPASNLIDPQEQREADREHLPRPKALDNLLKQYAGTHYQYDARGNLTQRWRNGEASRYTWDLFDRLTRYEDERLAVDYTYDALGRRLSKHSQAHYPEHREAGPHWNRAERVKHNRELQCGFTLYGWDGDALAWESKIADEDGLGARTTHYVYEPGSFVPLAQAVREEAIALIGQPVYGDYYRQDEDPLFFPPPPAPAIDSLAWYQCDHLGTPMELTDEQGEIVWGAQYRAWGVAQEAIRKAAGKASNPIRFQGQYHDHETGLHYNRYRYYDPEVGRFVSKDPIGYAGGLSLYQFAPNPVGWVDPLGLSGAVAVPAPISLPKVVPVPSVKPIGLLLPLLLTGDTPNRLPYLHATYTRTHPVTGQVYCGRTSGYGDPNVLVHRRGLQQGHLNAEGFAPPVLDNFSVNRDAIRGREQQLIDFHGGAQSVGGTARNKINGVSDINPLGKLYKYYSIKEFGELPDNSPPRARNW